MISYVFYCIYPKYWDNLTPYYTCPKVWTSSYYYLLMYLNIVDWLAENIDLDQMSQSATSDPGSTLYAQECLSQCSG